MALSATVLFTEEGESSLLGTIALALAVLKADPETQRLVPGLLCR